MSERGLFVTFEGVDGCGKTTQMRLLAERLRERGERVIETAEPGGTAIGKAIRAILLDPAHHNLSPTAEMLLYFAARAQNVDEVLEPALAAGCIVVSDRWTDSTLAYQGAGRGLGEEVVAALDVIACRGRKPDLTVWVDIDLETSLERARRRNEEAAANGAKRETRMDEQAGEFYSRVREAYQRLTETEPGRFARVEGRGTVEEVFERVWGAFEAFRQSHV